MIQRSHFDKFWKKIVFFNHRAKRGGSLFQGSSGGGKRGREATPPKGGAKPPLQGHKATHPLLGGSPPFVRLC